jgi:hypothetical protein
MGFAHGIDTLKHFTHNNTYVCFYFGKYSDSSMWQF